MSDEASELFWDAIGAGGGSGGCPVAQCKCGRTHFATADNPDIDEDDIVRMRECAKKNPDQYIEDSQDDSIGVAMIDGVGFCYGCPCGQLARYERFIWQNRAMIMRYLKSRADAEMKAALNDAAAPERIAGAQL